jgi:hypothetical protein
MKDHRDDVFRREDSAMPCSGTFGQVWGISGARFEGIAKEHRYRQTHGEDSLKPSLKVPNGLRVSPPRRQQGGAVAAGSCQGLRRTAMVIVLYGLLACHMERECFMVPSENPPGCPQVRMDRAIRL